jgi:transposase
VAQVIIGIDPHKGSHTALALDESEAKLGQLRVIAAPGQVEKLQRWAASWPDRVWAIEGARGLGQLLAQQLIGAGERVVDVQPKLAARVRLLNTGQVNKNDPNDARSVAVAALRTHSTVEVVAEDETAVLKLWSRRYQDLGSLRTQLVCRLHAVLCDLVPGGFARRISATQAIGVLESVTAHGAVAAAKVELAHELVADLHRIDAQRLDVKRRLAKAVAAAHTTVTDIHGVGPIIAAAVLGYAGDIRRFANRDHFAAYNGTAPIEASSGNHNVHRLSRRRNRQLNHAVHMAAVVQIRNSGTHGRIYYDRKRGEGMTGKCALRALKRRISDAIYARLVADESATRHTDLQDPGGHSGNDSASSATGSHPETPALRRSHSRVTDQTRTDPPDGTAPTTRKTQQRRS